MGVNQEIGLKSQKGITLIALVITIIVLLIFAGITIVTLTGENGILKQADNAKEQTEIAREKEIIALSVIGAKTKEDNSNIEKSELQEQLDLNAGEGKTVLYDDGDGWLVYFIDTQRVYSVEDNNIIQESSLQILEKDKTPGEFDGSGMQNDPYVIMSIEDLVYLSQMTNDGNTYQYKYFKLGKTLNFKSELSYCNTQTKAYNDFLGVPDDIGLLEALTSNQYA